MLKVYGRVTKKLDLDTMTAAVVRGLRKGMVRVLTEAQTISRQEYFRPGFQQRKGPNQRGGGAAPIPGKLTSRHGGAGLLGTVRPRVEVNGYFIRGFLGANRPYARIHEFGGQAGHAHLPPRPYLRPAIDDSLRRNWSLLRGYVLTEVNRAGSF